MDRANGDQSLRASSVGQADACTEPVDRPACARDDAATATGDVPKRPARRERPNSGARGSRLDGRLLISVRVRKAIRRLCAGAGPQHVVLTWPGGANYLPAWMHDAGPYDVVVGHVARCPIYADLRQLELFRTHRMVIDVEHERAPRRLLLNANHHRIR
jgi:hypothetical protein